MGKSRNNVSLVVSFLVRLTISGTLRLLKSLPPFDVLRKALVQIVHYTTTKGKAGRKTSRNQMIMSISVKSLNSQNPNGMVLQVPLMMKMMMGRKEVLAPGK